MNNSKPTPQQIKEILKSKKGKQQQQQKLDKDSDSGSQDEKLNNSYESLDGAEDLEDYKLEGYHPTILGETFSNGRYVIIQKLGWGHFSTVWLVYDKKKEEHFALKIQKSKKSYSEAALDELELLRDLRKHENDEEWKQFVAGFNGQLQEGNWIKQWNLKKPIQVEDLIEKEKAQEQQQLQTDDADFEDMSDKNDDEEPSILIPSYDDESLKFRITIEDHFTIRLVDNFVHFGMHGKHYCSVFEILGPTILDLIQHFDDHNKRIGLWLVKIITRQMLIGLVYMHDICQMIHTDLKPENIMIDLEVEQLKEFIEDLKNLKKKPLSMKFLSLLKQTSSAKNKKKYLKKKNKKKVQLEEEKTNETNDAITCESNSKVEDQNQGILEDKKVQQEKKEKDSAELEKKDKNENGLEKEKEKENPELEKKEKENPELEKKEKKVKKAKERDVKDKMQEESKSDSEFETDRSQSVNEEVLYTLKWKEHIQIKLTKMLRVKIVDFGNACWTHKHFTDNIQTREYRSPEVLLGMDYQANTDIWSLACIIFELLTDNYLFKPKKGDGFTKNDDHLALMIETLGRMNKNFISNGSHSRKYFNKSGHLINIKHLHSLPICDILINDYDFEMNDAYQIQSFLMPMLEYDPKKRVSARDALKHPWLWSY